MADITIRRAVTFTDAFRDLLKSQEYEKYVLIILNRSHNVFHGKRFTPIDKQSKGEADFIDSDGCLYDAKLIINKKQGALLGERKNDIKLWFEELLRECEEFTEKCIINREEYKIKETTLYNVLKDRVRSLHDNENGIMFIPYPIVDDTKELIVLQFTTDYLQAVYNQLEQDGDIGNREIYFIYPGMKKNEYVLRDSNRFRDYIDVPELEPFISFTTM